ncbi:hypothetical protein APR04_003558 [Promicromonospora umidemergens]|uniref:Uncharacterized protein n=1 Tax=Promicromonospora umidemergens TaxID=629679 RepID=A0ABP8Y2W0_9MICO|nr:hypothetical protein [Promicromonospora umidemergens]MCP2284635.1 hypothetical protein [Promicromonospora umidemergens]
MNHDRPTGTPVPGTRPEGRTRHDAQHDALAEQIAAALRSREPAAADTAALTQRIAARVGAAADGRSGAATPFVRRAGFIAVTGVVASALGVVGAATAAATDPYTEFAATVDGIAHAVGVDWSSMPDGYTREQYEAFWGAEYSYEDQVKLEEIWALDSTETKARAGQMILDGKELPFEPGRYTTPEPSVADTAAAHAFIDAGYDADDAEALSDLWETDFVEAKVRAGRMLLDGETPPLP